MTPPLVRTGGSDIGDGNDDQRNPLPDHTLPTDLSEPFPCIVQGCDLIHTLETFASTHPGRPLPTLGQVLTVESTPMRPLEDEHWDGRRWKQRVGRWDDRPMEAGHAGPPLTPVTATWGWSFVLPCPVEGCDQEHDWSGFTVAHFGNPGHTVDDGMARVRPPTPRTASPKGGHKHT